MPVALATRILGASTVRTVTHLGQFGIQMAPWAVPGGLLAGAWIYPALPNGITGLFAAEEK